MSTNKLAESIIEIMKTCGLSSNDALGIIHELSKPPLSIDDECDEVKSYRKFTVKPQYKVFANLTDEQKEEIENIESPVEILAKAAAKSSAEIDYESLKAHVRYKVASPDYRKQFMQVIDEHEAISDFCEYLIRKNMTLDDVYKAVDEYNNKQSCVSDEEPGDIADVMQDVYTSGEDPGDTHEPSKGSGAIDYDGLISAVAGHLDVNDWFTFNQIIKEHQEQNNHKEVKGND